jgi:Asp-tRNA(Asn)/Glu-tRNA(Gln) amidotransferase A subunit family amidase
LRKNQWCSEFKKDVEQYLAEYVKDDSMKTLADIIKVGTKSKYAEETLDYFSTNSGREKNPEMKCGSAYDDERRIAFREAIEKRMDELKLDAIIYPTWNNKPAKIDDFQKGYKGDSNQVIAPHTGQPAFTVPMGFTTGNLPAGIQFLGRMYSEPTLIKLSYSYEQATKHRIPATFDEK